MRAPHLTVLLALGGCADFSVFGQALDFAARGDLGRAALLSDDFESGTIDPARWTLERTPPDGTLEVQPVGSGNLALHVLAPADVNDTTVSIANRTVLAGRQAGFYLRFRLRLSAAPVYAFVRLRRSSPLLILLLANDPGGGYSVSSGDAVLGFHPFGMAKPDAWSCFEWAVLVPAAGTDRKSEITIDGMVVQTDLVPSTDVAVPDEIELGLNRCCGQVAGAEAWIDDVVIDSAPIGCP